MNKDKEEKTNIENGGEELETVTDSELSSDNNSDLDDSVVAEENALEAVKKLRERLKACEKDKQEYLIGWQRAKADMVNARKREENDRKDFIKFANEKLIEDILPVLDSFGMAMGNKEAWEKVDKNWRTGVEYIYGQLVKALTDNGLVEINPLGQPYDHNFHEAVSHEAVSEAGKDNMVIEVLQKGYTLNGKVLKAAKVKVG